MRRVSSGVSGGIPEILTATSFPDISTTGWLPGERIRSLTLVETLSIASNKAGVGTAFASTRIAGAIVVAVDKSFPSGTEHVYGCTLRSKQLSVRGANRNR